MTAKGKTAGKCCQFPPTVPDLGPFILA